MSDRFRCEYKITKKHLSQARLHTLLKYYHMEYVLYSLLAALVGWLIILSIIRKVLFGVLSISAMVYFCLIRNFIRFIRLAFSVPQEDVYPGESYKYEGVITINETAITQYDNDYNAVTTSLSEITQLGITVDTFVLYMKRGKIVIPQYSFVLGNKQEFVEFIKSKGIKISGRLHN
ncbi:MAG: hypothetical protein IKM61_04075 [Eubacteriaceae bacterium]|nr:hypothetical protein [Eubacteriaceae bacterium]